MSVEDDEFGLPRPPLPRPVRREVAIEAALRRFDGADSRGSPVGERPRQSWGSAHRPQLAIAVSAALLLVVGIPAALIGLRDQSTSSDRKPAARVLHDTTCVGNNCATQAAPPGQRSSASAAETKDAAPSDAALNASPAQRENRAPELREPPISEPQAKTGAPAVAAPPSAPALAAAPPPPPPPLPAPASASSRAVAEMDSEAPMARDVVVTGSRIPDPGRVAEEKSARGAPSSVTNTPVSQSLIGQAPLYRAFLSRLQGAVRAKDRAAITRLIAFPLRVNGRGGTRTYHDARSVERDFGRIFTAKVRRAILVQRTDQLFVRDQGIMIGNGEVWFAQSCPNAACSPPGPLRIVAINP